MRLADIQGPGQSFQAINPIRQGLSQQGNRALQGDRDSWRADLLELESCPAVLHFLAFALHWILLVQEPVVLSDVEGFRKDLADLRQGQ